MKVMPPATPVAVVLMDGVTTSGVLMVAAMLTVALWSFLVLQ